MRLHKREKVPAAGHFNLWQLLDQSRQAFLTRFTPPPFKQPSVQFPAKDSSQFQSAPYRVCVARTAKERREAYQLRFRIFNIELNEGLDRAYATGEDTDEFDPFCDHLLVHDESTGNVVGTYRLQTGASAQRNLGYYSAREFDFTPYESLAPKMVELGRACIHPDHRKYEVLMLLWKAITHYAVARGARYLIGCSSVTSQDPAVGSAMYQSLSRMLVAENLRTVPTEPFAFPMAETELQVRLPKLLKTYLAVGANICGPPALDREFKTIDFLTLMDLENLSPTISKRLLGR